MACPAAAPSWGRSYWALVLLLPGGLLIAAGIFVASFGVALCWPWLRRLTAVSAGKSVAPGRIYHRDRVPALQPSGASRDSGPRVWLN